MERTESSSSSEEESSTQSALLTESSSRGKVSKKAQPRRVVFQTEEQEQERRRRRGARTKRRTEDVTSPPPLVIKFEELKSDPETIVFTNVVNLDTDPLLFLPTSTTTTAATGTETPQYFIARGRDGALIVFKDEIIALRIKNAQINSQNLSLGDRLIRYIAGAMGYSDGSAILQSGSQQLVDDLIDLLRIVEVDGVLGATSGKRKFTLDRRRKYVAYLQKEEKEKRGAGSAVKEEEEEEERERIPIRENGIVDLLANLSNSPFKTNNRRDIGAALDMTAPTIASNGGFDGANRQITTDSIFTLSHPFQNVVLNLVARLLNADAEMIVTSCFYRIDDKVKEIPGGPKGITEKDILANANRMIKFAELVSKMKNLMESSRGWRYENTNMRDKQTNLEIEQLLIWFQNQFRPEPKDVPIHLLMRPFSNAVELLQYGRR